MKELEESPRPSLVVLVARWSMYTETTVDFAGGRRVFLVDNEHRNLDIETTREVLSRALGRTVDAIAALGIPVLLIGQPPEFFQDPNVCFVGEKSFRDATRLIASSCRERSRINACVRPRTSCKRSQVVERQRPI